MTSAETVLLQQHSVDEFLKLLEGGQSKVYVAVSPQSIASIAAHQGMDTSEQAFERLSTFLKSLGVVDVFDLSLFNDLALELSFLEFK